MAWDRIEVTRLKWMVERLREYSGRLNESISAAELAGVSEVVLQWKQMETAIRSIAGAVSLAETHIPDQIHCLKSGAVPMWQHSVTRAAITRANRAAAAKAEKMKAEGLVKKSKPKRKGQS